MAKPECVIMCQQCYKGNHIAIGVCVEGICDAGRHGQIGK